MIYIRLGDAEADGGNRWMPECCIMNYCYYYYYYYFFSVTKAPFKYFQQSALEIFTFLRVTTCVSLCLRLDS